MLEHARLSEMEERLRRLEAENRRLRQAQAFLGHAAGEAESARLSSILDCLDEAILVCDQSGALAIINSAARRTLGLWHDPPPRTLFQLASSVHFVAPDGSPLPFESTPFGRALAGATFQDSEWQVRLNDANEGSGWAFSASLVQSGSAAPSILFVVRDATERRRFERAVRESEERYRVLIETLPQLIWTCRPDGYCDYLSRQWVEYTGVPEAEQLGEGWVERLHPDDRERASRMFRAAIQGNGVYDLEYRIRDRHGHYRWFKTRGVPLRDSDGRILKWFGSCTDIEDQRRAAEEIAGSEQHLRSVLDTLFTFVGVMTPDGVLTMANRAPLDAAGLRPEDVIGKPFWEAYWWSWSPAVQQKVRRAIRSGAAGRPSRFDVEVRMAAGRLITIDFALVPMFDSAGSVVHLIPSGIDITERKRAEEALRESERQFRQLADAIPHMVWTTRPDGYHDYFNQRWYEYTGTTLAEVQGEGWASVLHPDDAARTTELWHHCLDTGDVYDIEYRFRRASDGAYRWFLGRAEPIRDTAGNIVRWFGTCTDIDDQKRAAQAVRETQERYRMLAMATNDAIWDWDLRTDRIEWNEALRILFGHDLGRIAPDSTSWTDNIHPDDRASVLASIHEVIDNGQYWTHEYRFRRQDGSYAPVLDRGFVARDDDGRAVRMVGSMLDLTAIRQAEEALRASRERLQAALDASGTGTFRWDFGTGQIDWDENVDRMFGLTPGTPRNREGFLSSVHPDDRQGVIDAILRSAREGAEIDVEYRVVWPDGTSHWVAVKGRFVLIGGKPVYMTGACVDMTERRRTEAAVREAQKLESLGVLAGGIAHDFNNLLVGILGNASLAQENVGAETPDWRRLQSIVSASERAADLTRQLLAYAGKGQFLPEAVNLSELVREINALIQTSIPRHVTVAFELADRLPLIEADRGQVQQVIMNLLLNAGEAVPENRHGSVTVRTYAKKFGREEVGRFDGPASASPGLYVALEVGDTGTGMDVATLGKIFDPFFTTKFTGRGLGLSAVQGIVRASKGGLRVVSSPGFGSTFTVLFPAISQLPEPAVEKRLAPVAGRGVVLVVEDEEVVRETVREALERYGYTVVAAEDGRAGVDALAAHPEVSVVLLDLTMPVMGGEEALDRMKAARPGLPVILTSGFSEADAVRRFRGKGLAGFIQKPYTAPRLAEKIASVLGAA